MCMIAHPVLLRQALEAFPSNLHSADSDRNFEVHFLLEQNCNTQSPENSKCFIKEGSKKGMCDRQMAQLENPMNRADLREQRVGSSEAKGCTPESRNS